MQAVELRLGIERIDLAESALQKNLDDPLGPRGMVRRRIGGFAGNGRCRAITTEAATINADLLAFIKG